jgi:phage-related protein
MKISEYLNNIKDKSNYVHNSLFLKSLDEYGCVYKYLIRLVDDSANRKEIFIELDETESELDLLDKTVINAIEVYPAN